MSRPTADLSQCLSDVWNVKESSRSLNLPLPVITLSVSRAKCSLRKLCAVDNGVKNRGWGSGGLLKPNPEPGS